MSRHRLGLLLGAAAGLSLIVAPMALAGAQGHDGPPPNAKPGECYGRVILPAVYGTASRQVVEREGWTETVRGAPVVDKVTRRVLVRPERVERVRTAPVYRTQVSWVERAGRSRIVREPSRYEIVRRKVLLEAGHAEWRRSDAPLAYGERAGQSVVQATGEVVCRVWVPARYGYTERKVLVSKGRSYEVVGPPRRVKLVRKVKVSDGGWTERRRPAVYRTEVVRKVVREARSRVIQHPTVYSTAQKPVLVRAESPGWARVLCGGAIAPGFMAQLQQALISRGFDPGPPDGYARPETYSALRMYQRQHGLAQGQLTLESARHLGLL